METLSKFHKAKHENEKRLLLKEVQIMDSLDRVTSLNSILAELFTSKPTKAAGSKKKATSTNIGSETANPVKEWIQTAVQIVGVFKQLKSITKKISKLLSKPAE